MGFKRPEVQIFSLRPKKTVVSNYGCFYFLFRRSFPSGGRKGRVFPTLFLPADIFAFPFYLLGLIAGQNAIPSRLFILRTYLFSRNSRRSLQIFSLRPKNSRKRLRLFLFSLSEKFSFRNHNILRKIFIVSRRELQIQVWLLQKE